jgi:Flp pilus assembly protein TadB
MILIAITLAGFIGIFGNLLLDFMHEHRVDRRPLTWWIMLALAAVAIYFFVRILRFFPPLIIVEGCALGLLLGIFLFNLIRRAKAARTTNK